MGLSLLGLAAGLARAATNVPQIEGCPVFTSANYWNRSVEDAPAVKDSAKHIAASQPAKPLHPDFGNDPTNGIPLNILKAPRHADDKRVVYKFEYADESDRVVYPVPAQPLIEGGPNGTGDRHLIVLDSIKCMLYEVFAYQGATEPGKPYKAGSGAVFDLYSDQLRPEHWTSADAAGLPITPGLIRWEEVAAGEIRHAIRFTLPQVRQAYIWPARHTVNHLQDPNLLPLGARLRLKAAVDISRFSTTNQVILKALKKYGLVLADVGSAWFISGVPDPHWNDDDLHKLTELKGSDFEEVDVSDWQIADDTAETFAPSRK